MIRKLFLATMLFIISASIPMAQTSGGQLCIRAFEDRNGNGTQDPNEPPIIRGISVTLADANGVIINTALMEASSSASSGTLCFQRLEAGQYNMRVASADYIATTPNDFTTVITDSGVPQVENYGGQFIPVETVVDNTADSQRVRLQSTLARSVVGGIGALIVMGAMTVIGALIYFFALRNRSQTPRTGAYRPVPQTGAYPAVSDTGQYPAVPQQTPPRGSAPIMDDTDMPDVRTVQDTYSMYSDDDEEGTNKPSQRVNNNPYADAPDDDFQFDDDSNNLPG